MVTLRSLQARQIYDSRGNPTVECDVLLSDGAKGRAAVPSGASTGEHEAVERRDGGERYGGKGVRQAVKTIHDDIFPLLRSIDPFDQVTVDRVMIEADGTDNKSKLGANAILAVSLAIAKACAQSSDISLYQYVASIAGTQDDKHLPMPMINIMNGGQHADFATDFQEYMIVPIGANSIDDALERSAAVFHTLARLLRLEGHAVTVGDEGGFAPRLTGGNARPLEYIVQAIEKCGYVAGKDIAVAIDVAASEFYASARYNLTAEQRNLDAPGMISYITELTQRFPIVSVEDGLAEDDWTHWHQMTSSIGKNIALVGDDLLVTNVTRLERAIESKAANAILIKPNQIGTLSETIKAVVMAKKNGWRTIMSHRSGETEDVTIAHLAVGLGCDAIKTGSLSRSERVAKYNELLRIAESETSLQLKRWSSL